MPQRFRFGSEDLWVVPRRDVIRVDDESRARAVVRELAQEPGALEAMLREAGIDPMPGTTEGDAEAELVRALASGRVVLVRTDEMPRLGRPSRGLGNRDDPDAPITPMKEPTFLGVTVLHESGAGYPGAIFNLALPAGELRTVTLDANSSFRLDDIPDKGTCRMRPFRHRYELTDEMRARAGAPVVTRADDVRARVGEDAGVGLRTGAEHRVVVADAILLNYRVRVVDEIGVALEGLALSMSIGKRDYGCTTDADGYASVDAPSESAAKARILDLAALRDLVGPRWEEARDEPWLEEKVDHTYVECADPLPAVQVQPELCQTIVVQPWVVRARLLELLFDTNRTFLLPSALVHIREIVRLYQRRPNAAVLIVGHTDATSTPDVNDPLSLARARSVRAFLQDDIDGWLPYYDADLPASTRWGEAEDQLMLQAVLSSAGEQPTDSPVLHFQTTRGLDPTGKIGPDTRRAIMTEYMAADGTTLPAGIEPLAHGCGENFPLPRDEGAEDLSTDELRALDRRVELFFFDADLGVLPQADSEQSGPNSTEYPEWCRRARETHDFFVSASTVTVRVLLGALDSDGSPPGDRPEALRLTSSDGLYERVLSYNEAIRVSLRHFAVEFDHVPVGVPCTLRADYHGEGKFAHVLFEDVDVGAESECGEGGLCQEQPPPAAPPASPDAPPATSDDDDHVAEFPFL